MSDEEYVSWKIAFGNRVTSVTFPKFGEEPVPGVSAAEYGRAKEKRNAFSYEEGQLVGGS